MIGQANAKYFMLLTDSKTLKCFDSDTGTVKWSQEFDDDFYSQVSYNENCYAIVGNNPLSCHDISNNEKLWEQKLYASIVELTPEYIYTVSTMILVNPIRFGGFNKSTLRQEKY